MVTTNNKQQDAQETLLNDGVFDQDLAGYAASAAAADLVVQWGTYGQPIDSATKRQDVELVIVALRAWATRL